MFETCRKYTLEVRKATSMGKTMVVVNKPTLQRLSSHMHLGFGNGFVAFGIVRASRRRL